MSKEPRLDDLTHKELSPLIRELSQAGFGADLAAYLRKPGMSALATRLLYRHLAVRKGNQDELIVKIRERVIRSEIDEELTSLAPHKPKEVLEQATQLQRIFGEVGVNFDLGNVSETQKCGYWFPVPLYGYFYPTAIPQLRCFIPEQIPTKKKNWKPIHFAMEKLMEAMDRVLGRDVCRFDHDFCTHVHLHWSTGGAYQRLGELAKGDMLVVPVQFGDLHRGETEELIHATMLPDEFMLDPFAFGCILLSHWESVREWTKSISDSVTIQCPGGVSHMGEERHSFWAWFLSNNQNGSLGFGTCGGGSWEQGNAHEIAVTGLCMDSGKYYT